MSAISYTAPLFTEDQEKREKESSTEEEIREVAKDVFGVEALIDETEELLATSLAQFAEELVAIHDEEKESYALALEKCPLVVEQETAPLRFLRADDYDAKRAATRLVKYWECRVELFGPDRAFLPMTLDGAMEDDIDCFEILRDGNYMLPHDNHGRAVYFSDKSRSTNERLTKDELLRILWYYVHASIEDESVQRSGFVMMANMNMTKLSHFNRGTVRRQFDQVREALPMKVRGLHGCHMPRFVKEWVYPAIKIFLGKRLRQRLNIHASNSLPQELFKYGFERENLPVCVGGTFQYDHTKWLAERRELEASRRS
jgi:CRAL/TRIO domain